MRHLKKKLKEKAFKANRFILLLVLLLLYPLYLTLKPQSSGPFYYLLIPKEAEKSIQTQVWMSAAQEEGVPLEILDYEEFVRPFGSSDTNARIILVPDEISKSAPAPLLSKLREYVQGGGKLVIVGDALSEDFNGRLSETLVIESFFHFPPLVGRVGDTIKSKSDSIRLTDEWLHALNIPPGRYSPSEWAAPSTQFRELCTYQSPLTPYPHSPTEAASKFKGTRILEASDGSLIAGISKLEKGQVLWVNLPLGYLKRRTDGLLLNSFLRWTSETWAGLPRLLSVPNGVGGMILNIHVDSNAALLGLEKMKKLNLFTEAGPFSIHVTAGPDARSEGDHLGFNLPENPTSQEWVRFWQKNGHEVGAHGGWIHDYFGAHLNEHETPEFDRFLELNRAAVEKITGKPVLEYSSPVGNHPAWVTGWLEAHGYNSYYFTGNSGMGPTQTYRDDVRTDHHAWAFPVSAYHQVASFEEASDNQVPGAEFGQWLEQLSQFASDSQQVRLFYFHPPGIHVYENALMAWVRYNHDLKARGKFKWYTMSAIADFLNARSQVSWKVHQTLKNREFEVVIEASERLKEMVWSFPHFSIKNVVVESGEADVREVGDQFQVQPKTNGKLVIRYEEAQGDYIK